MKSIVKLCFTVAGLVGLISTTMSAHVSASNWLSLQGLESPSAAERVHVWGFIQPEYQATKGSNLPAGPFKGSEAVFNQIRPDLTSDSSFNIFRARLGLRGTGLPIDSKVNYFLLFEAGNNAITNNEGGGVKMTDASITLNHFDAARIRIGQFKYPGSEEGLQAIHVFDYINFTSGTGQLLVERFFDATNGGGTDANAVKGSVGAFRDVGVQVFNTFKQSDWEHTYAVMLGNGNGIDRGDNDDNKEMYAYWASELVYGGSGPRRKGLKLYGWLQKGKRTLLDSGVTSEFDRDRAGIGSTFRKGKYRAGAEYVVADGMIFNGSRGGAVPGTVNAGGLVADNQILPNEEADSWYLDFGYKVLPEMELDIRYDRLNRATNIAANERKFETFTLGMQYFINKKTRFLLNYELRDAEAPNLSSSAVPNNILAETDDRISAQVLMVY